MKRNAVVVAALAVLFGAGVAWGASSFVQRFRIAYQYDPTVYAGCACTINGGAFLADVSVGAYACPTDPTSTCNDATATVIGGTTYQFQLTCTPLDVTQPVQGSNIIAVVAPTATPTITPLPTDTATPTLTATVTPSATRTPVPTSTPLPLPKLLGVEPIALATPTH